MSRLTLTLVLVSLVAALAVPAAVAAPVPAAQPGESTDPGAQPWERVPREQVADQCGLDPALLEQADLLMTGRPYVVVRHGKLCWESAGTDVAYHVASITKTMGGLLFGIAASRSSLSEEDPVTRWLDPSELGLVNPDARLAHILAMTATRPSLDYGTRGPWMYDTLGDREIDLLIRVIDRVIAQEPEGFPGVANAVELAQQELFEPLGMASSSWAGETIGFSLQSTVRDMARMGLLMEQRGAYGGEQVIDAEYAYRMTHPSFEDVNTGFGYLTYINANVNWYYSTGTNDPLCSPVGVWPEYPHRPFYEAPNDNGGGLLSPPTYDVGVNWASGAGGQRFIVHRGLDLVLAVRDESHNEGNKSVWSAIRPALVALDPEFAGDELGFCEAYRNGRYAPGLLPDLTVAAPRAQGPGFSAVVSNPGEQHAVAVPVRFSVDGEPVGPDVVVPELAFGGSAVVSSPPVALAPGIHTVTVEVDPDDALPEAGSAANAASTTVVVPGAPSAGVVERHGGTGRVETAVAVSGAARERADVVVLARADDPADALAGAPLAAHLDAPLLLSRGDGLSPATAQEIRRLGATQAVLLGGPAALGEQVAEDLLAVGVAVREVRRVAGDSRYATAAAIAAELPATGEAFVVRGDPGTFADAVAVSGLAATMRAPILLAEADRLPAETADALASTPLVLVIGGTDAVSEDIAAELAASGSGVRRLSGADRYSTSAAVAQEALARGQATAVTWVATGADFPDALVAGAAAAHDDALFVLVNGADLDGSPATRDLLAATPIATLRAAGGPAAVSDTALQQLAALLR